MKIEDIQNNSKEKILLSTTGTVDMVIYNVDDKDFYIVNSCSESIDSTIIPITKEIFKYLKSNKESTSQKSLEILYNLKNRDNEFINLEPYFVNPSLSTKDIDKR